MTARWRPAIVLSIGTMASAWALTPLFQVRSWVATAALFVAAVLLSGVAARHWLPRRRWVPVVQLVTLILLTGWIFDRSPTAPIPGTAQDASTLTFGLPTPATVGAWVDLLRDAGSVLRSNPAPTPTTPGVIFLLATSIGLLALIADLVGATLMMPALAGLPMLAPYLSAVANSNGTLPWPWFAAPAVAWLVLLADADRTVRRRWRSDEDAADGGSGESGIGKSRWSGAFAVGGGALVLAIVTAQLLPQLPVRYLAEGLGRGGLGSSGRVGFSTNLDLRTSLRATDQSTVLSYTTDDPAPGPLRVLVSDRFTGDAWEPQPYTTQPTKNPRPPATGYDDQVRTATRTVSIQATDLQAPQAAAPYGIVDGSMTDALWAVDQQTGLVVVDRTPASYRLDYLVPMPSQAQLREANGTHWPGDPGEVWADARALTAQDAHLLREALLGIVSDQAGPYQAAVAIQGWLRSPAFTYTLDGVPEPRPSGSSRPSDRPTLLAQFLNEKRGYCTHFATTMVLAARLYGIPARMAYGFLPGTKTADGYEIRQSDAHAWPELYFPQIGWLRFEPTPSVRSGNAPAYAGEYGAVTGPSLPTSGATTSAPTKTADPSDASARQRERDAEFDQDGEAIAPARARWWPLPATMVGIAAVTSLLMPLLSRLARRRDLARAHDDAQRAEVEWAYLTSALADLGFDPPASRTLRGQQSFYGYAAVLDHTQQRSLRAVGQTVERARYAPPGTALPDIGADADLVRRAAGELRSWRQRVRAWLWPGYAVTALRQMTAARSTRSSPQVEQDSKPQQAPSAPVDPDRPDPYHPPQG